MSGDNIKVAVRVRPLIERELTSGDGELWLVDGNTIQSTDPSDSRNNDLYTFDHIFGTNSTNKDIHNIVISPLVISCADGYNCTIFAYGQTSSGKTHTMEGNRTDPGIIPNVIDHLFDVVDQRDNNNFLIRVVYVEIYNERIYDLLNPNGCEVKMREDLQGNIIICANEPVTSTKDQVLELLKVGMKNRKTNATKMNIKSSRSHAIFRIIVECSEESTAGSKPPIQVSHFNLVDLAGSERLAQTKAIGQRLVEGAHINKSLSTLTLVISQLADQNKFINYRDSKLTLILRNALGGNTKTLIIANVTPASLEDTHSTLSFAKRAKTIKNKPTVNTVSVGPSVLRECKVQIERLRHELKNVTELNKGLVSDNAEEKRHVRILEDRIELIKKAFVKPQGFETVAKRRHTIGGGKSFASGQLFENIIAKDWQTPELSTPLTLVENRLLQVLRSNRNQSCGITSGLRNTLPFEAQLNLSRNIEDLELEDVQEEDPGEEELCVADYTVCDDDLEEELGDEMEFAQQTSSAMVEDDIPLIFRSDFSFDTIEYEEIEKMLMSKTSKEELMKDIKKITDQFNTVNCANSQMKCLVKIADEQNRALFDELAELTRKLNMEANEKMALQDKIAKIEKGVSAHISPDGDLQKKYENLLKEVDARDMEYFQLLRNKVSSDERIKLLMAENEKLRSVHGFQPSKVVDPSSSVADLTAQLSALNQKLVDQEEVISQLTNKHKRREEELLKRLEEREMPREKLLPEIMKTERQVQVSPETDDELCQTEKDERLVLIDTPAQTDSSDQGEATAFQIEEMEESVQQLENVTPGNYEVDISRVTVDMGVQALDIEMLEVSERSQEATAELERKVIGLATTEQQTQKLAKEQEILLRLLVSAKDTINNSISKYQALQALKSKDITSELDFKEACERFTNLIHNEVRTSKSFAEKASCSATVLNTLLTQVHAFKVFKEQDYRDIPAQLADQITTLRTEIQNAETKLETEKVISTTARTECNLAKAEIVKLQQQLHRVIPATTEKQILQDISHEMSDVGRLAHENMNLTHELTNAKSKIDELTQSNHGLATSVNNLETVLTGITKRFEKQLKKQEELESQLIILNAGKIERAVDNESIRKCLTKVELEPATVSEVPSHAPEGSAPIPEANLTLLYNENIQFRRHIRELQLTLKAQTLKLSECEDKFTNLSNAFDQKMLRLEENKMQAHVVLTMRITELDNLKTILENEIDFLGKEKGKLQFELELMKCEVDEIKEKLNKRGNEKEVVQQRLITVQKELERTQLNLETAEDRLLEAYENLTAKEKALEVLETKFKQYKKTFTSTGVQLNKDFVELTIRYQTCSEELVASRKRKAQEELEKQYYMRKYFDVCKTLAESYEKTTKATTRELCRSKSLSDLPIVTSASTGILSAYSTEDSGLPVQELPIDEIRAGLTDLQTILLRTASSPNVRARDEAIKLIDERNIEILSLKAEKEKLLQKVKGADALEKKITFLNNILCDSEKKRLELSQAVEKLTNENKALEKKMENCDRDVYTISATAEAYKEEIQQLHKIQQEWRLVKNQLVETVEEQKKEINDLKARCGPLIPTEVGKVESGDQQEKLVEEDSAYSSLIDEYQKILLTNEELKRKNKEIENVLANNIAVLKERDRSILSLRNSQDMKGAQLARAEADKVNMKMKLRKFELTLEATVKMQEELQGEVGNLKDVKAELSKKYEKKKEACDSLYYECLTLRTTVKDLKEFKQQLEQKISDLKALNASLVEQCKVMRDQPNPAEYNALREEMEVLKQECLSLTQHNQCLSETVEDLKNSYSKAGTEDPDMLQMMLHNKEQELDKIKVELTDVETKLNDTSKELRRIRSRCVCEGTTPSSSSLESRRMKKSSIQDLQRKIACNSCTELNDKVKKLEDKILHMAAHQQAQPSPSSTEEFYRCQTEVQQSQIEELNINVAKLQAQFATVTEERDTLIEQQSKATSDAASAASASSDIDIEDLRAQYKDLSMKYDHAKAIARRRAAHIQEFENKYGKL